MAVPNIYGLFKSTSCAAGPIPQISGIGNPSQLKRTTCDLCRERKVRCDRGKPECRRCKRAGQACTYPSPERDAATINSALQNLHSRLMQAERTIREHGIPLPTDSCISGSLSHSGSASLSVSHGPSLLSSAVDLGDVVSSDFGSWEQSMYIDYMGGLLTAEGALEDNGLQSDFSALSEDTDAIVSSHSPLAIWTADQSSGQPAAHHPNSGIRDDVSQISSVTIKHLFQAHFDVVQKHLQLIDPTDFLQSSESTTTTHSLQTQALKYAVAMSGASAIKDSTGLEQQCYMAARSRLEMAETQTDNSSFLNLETAQTLILVARYEFTHTNSARALITAARLMRLLSLLKYDTLDSFPSLVETDNSQKLPQVQEHSSAKVQEMRRTFWIAFSLHCYSATNFAGCGPIEIEMIHTALLSSSETREEDQQIFIAYALTRPIIEKLSPFSLFVLAMRLVAWTNLHHSMTSANVAGTGVPDYNFCLAHERIEIMIGAILSSLSSSALLTEPDVELRVLTLIITFGARIALYNTAIVNVQKATFLGPIVGESQKMGVSAANAMCDVLLQADVLNPNQVSVYKEMSLFIMRPLALAAEIQLCVLRNGIQGIGLNTYYTNREIRHSLEAICCAMKAFKDSTGQHELCIQECQEFLESTQFGKQFNAEFGV